MSFILNALRKSEQERQVLQSETVSDKSLLNNQPQQNSRKTAKSFAFLVIGNVLIITCVVWFVRNNSTPAHDTTTQITSKPLLAQEIVVKSTAIAKLTQPEKAEPKTTSIAEWVEEQKPEKPVITKKRQLILLSNPLLSTNQNYRHQPFRR